MKVKIFNKKINKEFIEYKHSNTQPFFLSSFSPWAILMISGLWITQPSLLRAMDGEDLGSPHCVSAVSLPEDNQENSENAVGFYKDSEHPLTQEFWKTKDISDRLKSIKKDIEKIKKEIINQNICSINFDENELEKYKKIFQCIEEDCEPVGGLKLIKYEHLLINSDNPQNVSVGYSDAKVVVLPYEGTNIVIKKFKDFKTGLEELFHSLIALNTNPSQKKLKIARVYDAVLSPDNCFNIIMEEARSHDLYHFLSTDFSESAIKAYAEYLATFHIKNHHKLNENLNRKKYINYASKFFNTLLNNPLKEEKKERELLSLAIGTPFFDFENDEIKSNNIIRVLSKKMQEKFVNFVKRSADHFEENSSAIYRLLTGNTEQQEPYFLTLTHGDAHGRNFFYDEDNELTHKGIQIRADSFYRITMIDFASMIRTYGKVGDPAEDVGRFLGSLWEWAAQQGDITQEVHKKMSTLQNQFVQSYLKKIEESSIFTEDTQKNFEKIFKENYDFYKLRFYRVIFNSKQDKGIKEKILMSWIKENSDLEDSAQESIQPDLVKEKSKDRAWTSVATDQENIIHWLPDPPVGFIESAAEGSNKSYLTLLWEELDRTGTATLSSKVAIAGMGGVGKTSLALEYAHEARNQQAYNLIYWLSSGTELSLVKGYRDLLREMGVPIKDADDELIINLIKQHVPDRDKCLLVYDNVPDPPFLNDKTPQGNTHILITSRCNEGWEKQPLNLEVFRLQDSVKYLFNTTGLRVNFENANIVKDLAKELAHLPLALSHAAHYIKLVGGTDVSSGIFEKYFEALSNEPTIHFEEYRNSFKEVKSEITYESLIKRTLRVSKKLLSELAKELMTYCAYLDPDSIAEDIFAEHFENNEKFEEALSQLYSLSFIKRIQQPPMFSTHRLVQLVIRNEKELSKEDQQYQKVFSDISTIFNKLFEKNINTPEQLDKLCNYLPHILQLLEHSRRLKISCHEINSLEWIGKIICVIKVYTEMHQRMSQSLSQENPAKYYENEKSEKIFKKMNTFLNNSTRSDNTLDDFPHWLLKIAENSHPIVQKSLIVFFTRGEMVNKDDKKAFYWCAKAAEQSDAEAQANLGYMYEAGYCVDQSDEEAIEWYTRAAQQGHARAQANLGCMYETGRGVVQSNEEAIKWYQKAAKKGDVRAQVELGRMYHSGRGVNRSEKKAIKWYKKAADQGDAEAQLRLGCMYKNGLGVVQNNKEAIEWYTRAAQQGHARAQVVVGYMYETGCGVDQSDEEAVKWYTRAAQQGDIRAEINLKLIAQCVVHNDKKAVESHKEAADQGDAEAQVTLGYMYETGRGVDRSDEKAVEWYQKAADQGYPLAQYILGGMYETGCGVDQSDEEAIKWYQKAADQGLAEAQLELGYVYEKGLWVAQSDEKAIEWYQKAADQEYPPAQYILGGMYETGRCVGQNGEEAIKWYQKAADQGYPSAQVALGARYEKGLGVDQSDKEAIEWYQKAADQEYPPAQYILGGMYENRWGVPKNYYEAIKWYQKAADQEYPPAQVSLARIQQPLLINMYNQN